MSHQKTKGTQHSQLQLYLIRWLSLFSLDAVLVALTWQEILARASHVRLAWQERALLGISVWIIYISDHLLDARSCPTLETMNTAPRHRFTQRHRSFFASAILVAFLIDISLLPHITRPLLVAGSLLALITFLYLVLNTFLLAHGVWPRGKEIAISFIFTLGCGLVPLVEAQKENILCCSMLGLLFLNSINCTLIARLERGVTVECLSKGLIPSPAWIVPGGLVLLFLNYLGNTTPIVTAFLGSLIGLSLIPKIAKHLGYEMASLATDGVLVLGGVLSLILH